MQPTATAVAHALNADFGVAKEAFRSEVRNASFKDGAIETARAELYATMARSGAMRDILRAAYRAGSERLPFHVSEWDSKPR